MTEEIVTQQDNTEAVKKYYEGFPEAPFSDSFKWIDADGFEHLSTVRAWTGSNLLAGISKTKLAIANQNGKPINNKPAPMPETASQQIQMTTEDGLPVVDGNQQPVMTTLPQGTHLFTVKEVYHDTNKDGDKHMLKVVISEDYQYGNKKYGISCFRPGPEFTGWGDWPVGQRYAPPVKAAKVIVRDPKQGGKYADIVEFRPA